MGYTAHSPELGSRGASLAPLSHTFAQHLVVRVHFSFMLLHNIEQLGYIAHATRFFRPHKIFLSACIKSVGKLTAKPYDSLMRCVRRRDNKEKQT